MAKPRTTRKLGIELTSLNQWMNHYGITKNRDEQFEEIAGDPARLGTVLASSTIDRILREKKGTTKTSRKRSKSHASQKSNTFPT